jgi:hypothetical protein
VPAIVRHQIAVVHAGGLGALELEVNAVRLLAAQHATAGGQTKGQLRQAKAELATLEGVLETLQPCLTQMLVAQLRGKVPLLYTLKANATTDGARAVMVAAIAETEVPGQLLDAIHRIPAMSAVQRPADGFAWSGPGVYVRGLNNVAEQLFHDRAEILAVFSAAINTISWTPDGPEAVVALVSLLHSPVERYRLLAATMLRQVVSRDSAARVAAVKAGAVDGLAAMLAMPGPDGGPDPGREQGAFVAAAGNGRGAQFNAMVALAALLSPATGGSSALAGGTLEEAAQLCGCRGLLDRNETLPALRADPTYPHDGDAHPDWLHPDETLRFLTTWDPKGKWLSGGKGEWDAAEVAVLERQFSASGLVEELLRRHGASPLRADETAMQQLVVRALSPPPNGGCRLAIALAGGPTELAEAFLEASARRDWPVGAAPSVDDSADGQSAALYDSWHVGRGAGFVLEETQRPNAQQSGCTAAAAMGVGRPLVELLASAAAELELHSQLALAAAELELHSQQATDATTGEELARVEETFRSLQASSAPAGFGLDPLEPPSAAALALPAAGVLLALALSKPESGADGEGAHQDFVFDWVRPLVALARHPDQALRRAAAAGLATMSAAGGNAQCYTIAAALAASLDACIHHRWYGDEPARTPASEVHGAQAMGQTLRVAQWVGRMQRHTTLGLNHTLAVIDRGGLRAMTLLFTNGTLAERAAAEVFLVGRVAQDRAFLDPGFPRAVRVPRAGQQGKPRRERGPPSDSIGALDIDAVRNRWPLQEEWAPLVHLVKVGAEQQALAVAEALLLLSRHGDTREAGRRPHIDIVQRTHVVPAVAWLMVSGRAGVRMAASRVLRFLADAGSTAIRTHVCAAVAVSLSELFGETLQMLPPPPEVYVGRGGGGTEAEDAWEREDRRAREQPREAGRQREEQAALAATRAAYEKEAVLVEKLLHSAEALAMFAEAFPEQSVAMANQQSVPMVHFTSATPVPVLSALIRYRCYCYNRRRGRLFASYEQLAVLCGGERECDRAACGAMVCTHSPLICPLDVCSRLHPQQPPTERAVFPHLFFHMCWRVAGARWRSLIRYGHRRPGGNGTVDAAFVGPSSPAAFQLVRSTAAKALGRLAAGRTQGHRDIRMAAVGDGAVQAREITPLNPSSNALAHHGRCGVGKRELALAPCWLTQTRLHRCTNGRRGAGAAGAHAELGARDGGAARGGRAGAGAAAGGRAGGRRLQPAAGAGARRARRPGGAVTGG